MDRAKVRINKPTSARATRTEANPEHRANPAENFGLELEVREGAPDALPRTYHSGVPAAEGLAATKGSLLPPGNQLYREVIPQGRIGSEEGYDPQLPASQYIDTVPWTRDEEKDPRLHGAMDALRSADTRTIPCAEYGQFQPRSAPIPRARQDEGVLGSMASMSADPLMTDQDSFTMILDRDDPRRKDLYGDNRAGVLHNQNEAVPPEDQRAQLSIRRGQAAASMPPGEEKRKFISRQGDEESKGMTSIGFKRLSEEAGRKGY